VGVIRRLQRDDVHKGSVGIQTIAKSAQLVQLSMGAGAGAETGILLSDGSDARGEARLLLRSGMFAPGQNLEYQKGDLTCLLMPQGVIASGDEYEVVKYREMVRDTSSDGDE
jgi:hypothetical protein